MKRIVGMLLVLGVSGCKKELPGWARLEAGTSGDATIAGEPAKVARFAAKPTLDGKLDDPAWGSAARLGPLVDTFSGQAAPADHPVASVARMGWDDQALYLALVVNDGKPTSPFGRDENDPHVWGKSSGVELMLQPGDPGDNKDYYELQVDVNGAVFDSHFDDYNAPITGQGADKIFGHQDWSARAERAIFVQSGAFWSVEIAVPWSSFAEGRVAIPPKPGDVWRLNLYTFRDGQRRALGWSPIRGQGNFHKASRFGRVRFD